MLKTYETGHTFTPAGERNMFCLTVLSRGKTALADSPLLRAKSDILHALEKAGYAATVRTAAPSMPYAHDGRSAEIIAGSTVIGSLFEIHPAIAASLGLTGRAAAAVLDLDVLLSLPAMVMITKNIPVFPAITFDETVPVGGKRTHALRMTALRNIDPLLESIDVTDLYESDASRTITLRFTYRSPDRTLTEEEVKRVHEKVLAELRTSGQ